MMMKEPKSLNRVLLKLFVNDVDYIISPDNGEVIFFFKPNGELSFKIFKLSHFAADDLLTVTDPLDFSFKNDKYFLNEEKKILDWIDDAFSTPHPPSNNDGPRPGLT